MKGYHGHPEATAEAFAGGWFHTGDLGYVDEDGFFFIVDRKKDLIIRGGYNVYPREVEDVLYTHPAVAEAAVVGVPDDRLGQEVKAVVALRPGQQATEAELIELRQGAGRLLQVPAVGRVPRPPADERHRQDPQAGAVSAMDRMSPLDAAFLQAEDEEPGVSLAIASIAVFEGPAPTTDEFAAALAGRLPLIPRYRQKAREVPLDLGPPVWVDDPALRPRLPPAPHRAARSGRRRELAALMGRVMSARLDRTRPLWEYWVVEGLAEGRWALISKVHHCMVDGISGTDLYRVVLDQSPEPRAPVADDWHPQPEPSALELARRRGARPGPAAAAARPAPRRRGPRPADVRPAGADAVRGRPPWPTALRPAARSSLSGPCPRSAGSPSPGARSRTSRAVRHALGGTFNDVVLAAVTAGFRTLLLSRGEEPTRTGGPHSRARVRPAPRAPRACGTTRCR